MRRIINLLKRFLKKKKLVMTLLVRDEEDILETNIKYHLSIGVDFFIISDNRSVDKTPEIISKYVKMGVAKCIPRNEDVYYQSKWVTEMARMAYSEYNASWVINNDADEFWWSPENNLKTELGKIPKDIGVIKVNRNDFLQRINKGLKFYEHMDVRAIESLNHIGKPLPPKAMHRAIPYVDVSTGNHDALGKGLEKIIISNSLEIFHFPMRSYKQFENKIILGGNALNLNNLLSKDTGATWRHLFEIQKKGELQAFYNKSLYSDEEIEVMIAEKKLLRDTRLKDYLNKTIHWD